MKSQTDDIKTRMYFHCRMTLQINQFDKKNYDTWGSLIYIGLAWNRKFYRNWLSDLNLTRYQNWTRNFQFKKFNGRGISKCNESQYIGIFLPSKFFLDNRPKTSRKELKYYLTEKNIFDLEALNV